MRKKWIAWGLLVALSLGVFGACKKDDTDEGVKEKPLVQINSLIKDGKSDYKIVYPRGEDAPRFAATEMQEYLKESTGVTVPVLSDYALSYSQSEKYISLGKTDLLEQINLDYDYSTMKTDGFFVKTVGNSVFIDGPSDRSVIYGAYDFLEEEVGVRFVTVDYDYVPENDEVKIMSWDRMENPDFIGRSYYNSSTNHYSDFCVKMRMSHGMMDIPDEMGGNFGWADTIVANHNCLYYVKQSEYPYADYPEFYVVKNGGVKDICWTYGITEDGKIDENIPLSPIRIAIESLKDFVLRADKHSKYFMFAQMDGNAFCTCDRCLVDSGKYRYSGIAIRFVNILAEEIQKWADAELGGREVNIVTFAYEHTVAAPVTYSEDGGLMLLDPTVKPRDNVIIRLAPLGYTTYYAYNDSEHTANPFEEWMFVHNRFFLWSYHTDFANRFDIASTMHMWNQQMNYLYDIGVEDVFMQSTYNDSEGDTYKESLDCYVASRVLWDRNTNIAEVVEEFHRLYFGEAAYPYVNEYVDRHMACVHTGYANGTLYYGKVQPSASATSAVNFPLPFVLKQLDLMEQAMTATEEDRSITEEEREMYRKNLVGLRLYAKYLQLDNYLNYYETTVGRYELAKEFKEECVYVNLTRYGEGSSMQNYLLQYGV